MKKILTIIPIIFMIGSCSLGNTEIDQTGGNQSSGYEAELEQASSRIKNSEEFNACMNMNVPMCIQNAGMQIAQKEKTTDVCKELPTPEQQEACVFTVTVINAEEKGDKSLCSILSGNYLVQCEKSIIKSQAIKTKNPTLCKEIVSDGTTETSREECMLNAIVNDDSSKKETCSIITDENIQSMCKNMLDSRAVISSGTEPSVTQ